MPDAPTPAPAAPTPENTFYRLHKPVGYWGAGATVTGAQLANAIKERGEKPLESLLADKTVEVARPAP